METLAIKYRPKTWEDVTEQSSIKVILEQQLETGTIKNAYLFCGPAGCGKTTCARIFANEINEGMGSPIEMDAASNSGVEDVRNIVQQAKLKSIDSPYKIFIIDECHAISNTGWQAFLKLIEEPPKFTIFIFCTTDPQKIPKTILSRVQRYDFRRISQEGICRRLELIYQAEAVENDWKANYNYKDGMEYIAKLADGGMRDAITLLDKCLSYNTNLTLENVVKALGTVDYDVMRKLTQAVVEGTSKTVLQIVEEVHSSGKDVKQFINQYTQFLLDVQKYYITESFKYMQLPGTKENVEWLQDTPEDVFDICGELLGSMIHLNSAVKWSQTPKYDLEAELLLFMMEGEE